MKNIEDVSFLKTLSKIVKEAMLKELSLSPNSFLTDMSFDEIKKFFWNRVFVLENTEKYYEVYHVNSDERLKELISCLNNE